MKQLNLLVLGLFSLALVNCSKASSDPSTYDTTSAQVAGEAISGVAAQSDDSSGANVALMMKPKSFNQTLSELLFPTANASVACTLTPSAKIKSNSGGCTTTNMTLTLNNCTAASGLVTWSGSMLLTFSAAGVCTKADADGMVGMATVGGESVTITSAGGITRTGPLGGYVTTDSNASGYYSPQKSGGLTVTCVDSACGDGTSGSSRTVSVAGLHRAEYTMRGIELYDHTISTTTPLAFNGTGANRVLSAGTLVLDHNLLGYTATTQISSAVSFSSGCCWPTSGTISTTFSGSKTGSESVTFGPSCGTASINGTTPFTFQNCN